MRQYQALGWYNIKGRGRVAAVSNDEAFARDTGHLIGETVEIDGICYKVLGVESFALATIRKGAEIGLLVESKMPCLICGKPGRHPECLNRNYYLSAEVKP